VKRAVQSQLETMLAKAILRGEIKDEDAITVDIGPGEPKHLVMFAEKKEVDPNEPVEESVRATLSS